MKNDEEASSEPIELREDLDYLNDVLTTDYRRSDVTHKEENPNTGTLSIDDLTNIYNLHEELIKLKNLGITIDNYKKKAEQYFSYRKKLFEQHGVQLSSIYPNPNPKTIHLKIYNILKSKLNDEQIAIFYQETAIRKRVPKSDDISKYRQISLKELLPMSGDISGFDDSLSDE